MTNGKDDRKMKLYPMKLIAPLKDYLWGGTRLKEDYGVHLLLHLSIRRHRQLCISFIGKLGIGYGVS